MVSGRFLPVLLLLAVLLVAQLFGAAVPGLAARPIRAECVRLQGHATPAFCSRRLFDRRPPGPAIEQYVRPELQRQMLELRPAILAAAERHNRDQLSNMSDRDFAVVIALVLYNEHFGSLEDALPIVRPLTPAYQRVQVYMNYGAGANLSVWPTNLRPSVAIEILRRQLPMPAPIDMVSVPVSVHGTAIDLREYSSQRELYAAVTAELTDPPLAVEYLAANLERGVYRAQYEGVPVTWRALAAWHNQGIVSPRDIRANPIASDYLRRTSAYLPIAEALIDSSGPCAMISCSIDADAPAAPPDGPAVALRLPPRPRSSLLY